MYDDRRRQVQRFFYKGGTPLTIGVLVAHVVLYFLILGLPQVHLARWIAFSTQDWAAAFWTLFTWPLAGAYDPLSLLFAVGWFYLFSGSLERAWGSRDYGIFLAAVASLTAFGMWVGSFLVGHGFAAGLWMISGPLAVAWSVVNSRERIGIFFVQVPAPVVALLGAALTWYYGGAAYGNPLLGLFALLGCAAAYWYATKGRFAYQGYSRRGGGNFGPRRSSDTRPETSARFRDFDHERGGRRAGFDPLRWWKDRQERKRLEEIFRRSGFTDDEKKNR
jgi:hypothetical protein